MLPNSTIKKKEMLLERGIAKVYLLKKYYYNKRYGTHPLEKVLLKDIIAIREKFIETLKKEIKAYENKD